MTGRVPVTWEVRVICPVRVESERQVPLIAKHPVEILSPTLEVEVASAEIFNPLSVVVPVDDISRAEIDDVAYVVGEAVAK